MGVRGWLQKIINENYAQQLSLSVFFQVFGLFLSFILSIILARYIGVAAVGVVAFSRSLSVFIKFLISLGSSPLVVKEVALVAGGSVDTGVVRAIVRVRVILTVIFLLVAVSLFSIFTVFGYDEEIPVNLLFLIAFVVGGLSSLWSEILKGMGNSWVGFSLEQSLTLAILTPILFLAGSYFGFTVNVAAICYLVSYFLSVVVGFTVVRRRFPIFSGDVEPCSVVDVFVKSKPFMVTAAMGLFISHVDMIMLGFLAPMEQVGIYSVSLNLAMLTSVLLISTNSIIGPKIAQHYSRGNILALECLASIVSILYISVGISAVIFMALWGGWLQSLWGIEGFSYLLLVLVAGQFFRMLYGPSALLLTMTEYAHVQMKVSVFAALFNIPLNYFLIDKYGVFGAAFATSITLSIINFLAWIQVKKKLGFYVVPKFFVRI